MTMRSNKAIVNAAGQTITTAGLAAGGALNPEQAKKFIQQTFEATPLSGLVRHELRSAKTGEIDKIGVGRRLLRKKTENTDSMFAAITLGASEYPYHPDGGKCVMYSAADIITLYSEYKSFVTKQTTYCNALRQWAKRETDPNVIGSIYYGCTLPEDLEKEVEGILSAAQAQITAIINKLSA